MGETLFKLSTKSVIEILGPPEKIETISSDLASKNTLVKKALGLTECTFFSPITADFTFAATVEVIALLGLTPVLVDVDPITFNIDVKAIKNAITPNTKAIVPVHLFGLAANEYYNQYSADLIIHYIKQFNEILYRTFNFKREHCKTSTWCA